MPSIIIHGGAKTISDDKAKANISGCLAAVEAGWTILTGGGNVKDAVEAAIRVLEDNPIFNASIGATLDTDGEVFLDAAMMEGATLGWGGVAAVQGVRHPISVARKILGEKSMLLVSKGAERFAEEHGDDMCAPSDLISDEQRQEWEEQEAVKDRPATVGCVAGIGEMCFSARRSANDCAQQPGVGGDEGNPPLTPKRRGTGNGEE
ncbi:MAG TPA: isoaspartyl peptidase/L-asparaginase [Leptolyngbyaceae cyanobacterium]